MVQQTAPQVPHCDLTLSFSSQNQHHSLFFEEDGGTAPSLETYGEAPAEQFITNENNLDFILEMIEECKNNKISFYSALKKLSSICSENSL